MTRRYLLLLAAIAVAYAMSGRLGLLLAIPPGYATALFPSAGIALACCLQFGYRVLPGIWLGSWLMNLSVSVPLGTWPAPATLLLTASIALGAVLQAAAGTWLVRRWTAQPLQLDDEHSLLRFAIGGGTLSTVLSASLGISLLHQTGQISATEAPYSWLTWWVGDSIGVLIVTPLVLLLLGGAQSRPLLRAVLLPVLITFALVTVVFVRASNWESQQLQDRFQVRAGQIAREIRSQFERQWMHAQQLERFFASSQQVTPAEFARYTADLLHQEQGAVSFAWVRHIPAAERRLFEQQMQAFGLPDYQLWQWQHGERQPVSARAHYYPIAYIEPTGSHGLRGFDNGSEPLRQRTMETALARGVLTVSEPLQLQQLASNDIAVLAALPIGRDDSERSSETRALVVLAIRLTSLITSALANEPPGRLSVNLRDLQATPEQALLFSNADPAPASAFESGFRFYQTLALGDRNWRIEIGATAQYLAEQRSWQAWLVLVAGMMFTGLTGAVLLLSQGRTLKVQRLVKLRTAELQQQQQTLQTITDSTPDAVLLLDHDGRIQMANPAAAFLLQQSDAALRNRSLAEWLPQWQASWLATAEQQGLQGIRHETRLQQPDGNIREVELALTGMQRREDSRYCCLLHDLTERVAVETMKREFVALVSHELRTPLTSIRGSLALLRGLGANAEPAQAQQLLRMADDNSKRLLVLVNDLLDFEKLELGKLDVVLNTVALRPLLETAIAELHGFANSQSVSLQLQWLLPDDCQLALAPDRFAQVLANLLSNAIKFSAAGDSVQIRAQRHDNQIRIDVIDHGIGIPAHQQDKLFQKFWQADTSTSRRHSGTGLGLAISRGLVEAMAGQIGFHSVEGQGSTFWLAFPVPEAQT